MKFLYLLLLASSPAWADPCQEIRGSLDMHGASTKALAALVDVCKKEVLKTVYQAEAPNTFGEELEKAADKKISPALVASNAAKIKELVDHMKEKGAGHILALAGEAFRAAANGTDAAAQLSAAIGAPVRVLEQQEEEQLFYLAGLAAHRVPLTAQDGVAVWRISDAGMMIHAESGETQDYTSNLGTDAFRDKVQQDLERGREGSPNPLGNVWRKAVASAQKDAKEVPAYFRKKNGPRRWLAIGDALAISVQGQVKKKAHSFTMAELENTLKKRSAWKDDKIGGTKPQEEVTNLALVLGYMKALNIKKVETATSSLNQGLLLMQLFNPLRDAAPAAPTATSTGASASALSTATVTTTVTATTTGTAQ